MSALLERLRSPSQYPTSAACREALLFAAGDEELTPTQIRRLHDEYGNAVSTDAEFDRLFTSLRELVETHRDIRDYGDERAIAFYQTTDRDDAADRCEQDVFEVLSLLAPERRLASVPARGVA